MVSVFEHIETLYNTQKSQSLMNYLSSEEFGGLIDKQKMTA